MENNTPGCDIKALAGGQWVDMELYARQQVDCRRIGLHERAFMDLLIEHSLACRRFKAIFPSHQFIADALYIEDEARLTKGHVSFAVAGLREKRMISAKAFEVKRGTLRQVELYGLNPLFDDWVPKPRRKLAAVPEQLAMEFDRWARSSGQLDDELIKSFVEGLYTGPTPVYARCGGAELPLVSERARQSLDPIGKGTLKVDDVADPVTDSQRGPEGAPVLAAASFQQAKPALNDEQKRAAECALLRRLRDALARGSLSEEASALIAEATQGLDPASDAKVALPTANPQEVSAKKITFADKASCGAKALRAREVLEKLDGSGAVQKLSDPLLREQWWELCESQPDYVLGHLAGLWQYRSKKKNPPANPLSYLARVAINDGRLRPLAG